MRRLVLSRSVSVGDRIKEARREHLAWTQRELAAKLDTDPVNVSRWERGVAEPSLRFVREIAELAGLPVSWFFAEDEAGVAA